MKVNIDIPEDMLKVIDDKCKAEFFSRSEWIRTALRDKLFAKTFVEAPQKVYEELSTMPPQIEPIKKSTIPSKIEPEALWEDYNLMPVYKTGVPDQYCVTWHAKGERRTVYPIKKFRADGSVELEGNYCKDCIKEFLTKDGHLE